MSQYKYTATFTFDNKRVYVRANTQRELGQKLERKRRELENKQQLAEKKITVSQYIPRCVDTWKQGTEDSKENYKKILNRGIGQYIGDYFLEKITPKLCQDTLNIQSGRSNTQIKYIYQGLKFIFSHALAEKLIADDPTLNLVKPKGTHNPRRALTPLEREIVIETAKTDRKYYWLLLMIYCGCRPSEACNCKGSDISIVDETPTLHIRGTKTAKSDRYVPIPKDLYKIIKKTKPNEYISVYPSGLVIKPDNRRRLWQGFWYKINRKAGTKTYRNRLLEPYVIPKDLTPYCLRHEYCSELARRGVDIRIAQTLMGHSNISMTANIYTHIENKNILSSVAKLID